MAKKILLADDSITIQKVIELTFSDEDFEVVTVGNGRLALEKLNEVRPDVVLCDIVMPEKDGYEVCRQIKSNPTLSQVPVLLLTGAFEPFDQDKAAQVGSDGFLAKPFEPETLIAKVKDLLGRAGGRAEVAPPAAGEPAAEAAPAAPRVVPPPSAAEHAATATTAPQATVSPSSPAATPPAGEPEEPMTASFISEEEPFPTLDAGADNETAAGEAGEGLAPVTPEESATLAGEPSVDGDAQSADAASTVMFNAGDLPWTEQPPPPTAEPAERGAEPPGESGFVRSSDTQDLAEEAGAAFEEVLEEDLEFGGAGGPSGAPAESHGPRARAVFTPGEPLSEDAEGGPGAEPAPTFEFETPAEPERPAPAPPLETVPPLDTAPPVPPEAPPSFEVAEPEPSVPEPPRPQAPRQQETVPPVRPEPEAAPAPPPEAPAPEPSLEPLAGPPASTPPAEARAAEEASFADVRVRPEPEPVPASDSEAASVPVPVEQVEKIAQRVVAQVSEKIVREIAWDVIPDLAEALIKQEIERLKAELQKL
jgi:CheY-like chemotaxis protein